MLKCVGTCVGVSECSSVWARVCAGVDAQVCGHVCVGVRAQVCGHVCVGVSAQV